MNDPHVKALYYRFISKDPMEKFEKAKPLSITFGTFDVELESQILTAQSTTHFSLVDEARAELETYLRAWEDSALIAPERHRIQFEFWRSEVIDRNPKPGVISVSGGIVATSSLKATLTQNHASYPDPNMEFVSSSLTERLASSYRRLCDGHDRVTTMAYLVLSEIELAFGGGQGGERREAAKRICVSLNLLNTLATLANANDPNLRRKASKRPIRILTEQELRWLKVVTARLILRVGEHNRDPSKLSCLDRGDFPSLPG